MAGTMAGIQVGILVMALDGQIIITSMILSGEVTIGVRHGIVLTTLGVLIHGDIIRGDLTHGDMVTTIGMVGDTGHIITLVAGDITNMKTTTTLQQELIAHEVMAQEQACQEVQMEEGFPCPKVDKPKLHNLIKVELLCQNLAMMHN
jgi:hypothetical protein